MKLFFSFLVGLLLLGCSAPNQLPPARNATSSSAVLIKIPSEWAIKQLADLPLQIALPIQAIVTSENNKYGGISTKGVGIYSQSNAEYYKTNHIPASYFQFGLFQVAGYSTASEFIESVCPPEGRKYGSGMKILERWSQSGMEFLKYTPWNCWDGEVPKAKTGHGIIFGSGSNLFRIALPDGDLGEHGLENLEIAIHSIRPIAK